MKSLIDLWNGIVKHPFKLGAYAFTAFSVIYTIIQAVNEFIPEITIKGKFALIAVVLISIVYSLKKVWKPSKVEIKIANANTSIEVVFGDLFTQKGIRSIAVNEFFDSKIGKPVSDKSLHGIFIQKCFGGHPEPFDKQIETQLINIKNEEVTKIDGKSKKYPIGTTAIVSVNSDQYLVFALTKTDTSTCKAYSDVDMMWVALSKLWERARIESGGHDINLPLIGSGLSGLGLPTRDLLNLIILSAITETKAKEVTHKIRIVLHQDRFEDLDLRDVKKHWEED
ncbi:MAG: DUF6430 domain-containing protein [Methylotenera sp.]|nr:DUF6430 domain-containing protein [Methylotenera sp.]